MTASGMVPSAIAGRIRCERALRKAPWSEASSESTSMKPVTGAMSYWIAMRPDTGVQPSQTENVRMSSSPHQRIVPGGVALDRRDDAGGQTDRQCEQHGDEGKLDRRRKARHEFGEDRLVRDRREPEIAVQRLPHVVAVLHRPLPVEPAL